MYIYKMNISFDPDKRQKTLDERGLDFLDCSGLWDGIHFTFEDTRMNYGEVRYISAGYIDDSILVIVWTWRSQQRRIISMRKANEREQSHFKQYL